MLRIDTGRPILLYLKLDVHCSDVLRFRRNRIEIVLPMSTRPQSNLVYKWHLKTQTQNWNVSPTFLIVCNSSLYQVYCEWRRSPISDMACQIQSAIALHTTVLTEPIHYTHCTFYTSTHFKTHGGEKFETHIWYIRVPYTWFTLHRKREQKKQCGSHICYIGGPISTTSYTVCSLPWYYNMTGLKKTTSAKALKSPDLPTVCEIPLWKTLSGISVKYHCENTDGKCDEYWWQNWFWW